MQGKFEPGGKSHVTRDEVRQLAEDWIAAWNAHDLEAIISHYDERVELISPVAEQLLGIPKWKGKW